MAEVRFDRMVPSDVVARRSRCNLAYLPVGSLEWHGNHMPFGTDYFTVTCVAEECARRYGGVVFPPVYYDDVRYILQENRAEWYRTYSASMQVPEAYSKMFPLSDADGSPGYDCPTQPDDGPAAEEPLEFTRAGMARQFARHIAMILLEIHLYGFRRVLLLPGHGPNPEYCRRAEEVYRQNVARRSAFGPPAATKTVFYIDFAAPHEPMMGQHWLHADRWEGSVTMVAAPGTVRPELLPHDPDTIPPAFLGHPYLTETEGYNPEMADKMKYFRYFDPRSGTTEEYGRRQLEGILADLGPVIREFVREGK
jgi:creatinine amidohydrolase/Fe(II)-dependent formamide hydrolase-like protein